MTCPKCNKEAQAEWIFCPFCQNPLKEKCPECGEMEWVGRNVCQTRIALIFEQANQFATDNVSKLNKYVPIAMVVVSAVGFVGMISPFVLQFWIKAPALFRGLFFSGITVMLAGAFSGLFADTLIIDKRRRKAKKEFFQKFPEYAEILKKAEGEK